MKRLPIAVSLLWLALLPACSPEHSPDADFYYWKSNYTMGHTERAYFRQLHSQRLFLRLFDVDIDHGEPVPVGQIQGLHQGQLPADSTEVIPVVFITNRTFLLCTDEAQITKLAANVCSGIAHFMGQAEATYKEIQIDCDWTPRTRQAYFRFLSALASQSQRRISCTLRLHQIRDHKQTGVPPVGYGCLMCYATSSPQEGMTRNSILDMALLKGYTQNINDYPLPFDVILPIYSWGVVTNHLGKVKLVNGLTEADLQTPMFEKIGENLYMVKEDGFVQSLFVNSGFKIKIEAITPELLGEARAYLDEQIDRDFRWIYFHLSKGFLTRFTIDELTQ